MQHTAPDLPSLLRRLERPTGPVDVVLDTDTYNEVDDQFALSYLLASQEQLSLKALYAAPFFNENSTGPADGMEKAMPKFFGSWTWPAANFPESWFSGAPRTIFPMRRRRFPRLQPSIWQSLPGNIPLTIPCMWWPLGR